MGIHAWNPPKYVTIGEDRGKIRTNERDRMRRSPTCMERSSSKNETYKEAKRARQIKTQNKKTERQTDRTIEKTIAHRMTSAREGSRKVL